MHCVSCCRNSNSQFMNRKKDVGWRMWDVGCRMWDVGCGMWDVGCRMWDVGCGMSDVGCLKKSGSLMNLFWALIHDID